MTNVCDFEKEQSMRSSEIVKSLMSAGFTNQQALGLTTVIIGIRAGVISMDDAEQFLEKNGFEDSTAEKLTKVFFQVLAAA
ncbi:MAG: hypothetical protein ACSHYC_15830 [Alphaproteobacteria bacterium]